VVYVLACGASATSEKTRPWIFGTCILLILWYFVILSDLEAPWYRKHPGDTQEAPTVGFPPRLGALQAFSCGHKHIDTHGHKLHQQRALGWGKLTSKWLMEYTKHLENVSRKDDTIIVKHQKIHLGASILTRFWALDPARGRPGDHPGLGTLKITKKTLSGTLLWEHICDIC